jgi:hypothetical protein
MGPSIDTAVSPRAGLRRAAWRRLSVFALLCAIASQLLLPLAHASVGLARTASARSSVVGQTHFAAHGVEVSRAAAPADHDPATCGVCQSLFHAKPVAPPPAVPARWLPELASLLVAPVVRAHAAVARTGHPPRAPPLAALSFA